MNHPIRYRGIVIEDVPGAPWTFGYGNPQPNVLNFAVRAVIPDYASDEMRLACWDNLVASIFGTCDLCKATAPTPAALKTAPPDARGYIGGCLLVHHDDCQCGDDRIAWLDLRDDPAGLGMEPDMSERSLVVLADYLATAVEALR